MPRSRICKAASSAGFAPHVALAPAHGAKAVEAMIAAERIDVHDAERPLHEPETARAPRKRAPAARTDRTGAHTGLIARPIGRPGSDSDRGLPMIRI